MRFRPDETARITKPEPFGNSRTCSRLWASGALGRIGLLVLPLIVAGCSDAVDSRRAETCRIAAVAVFDPLTLQVLAQTAFGEPDGQAGIALDLQSKEDGARHHIECRFATAGASHSNDLVGIRTEAGPLSGPRFFVLKRFWLGTLDASGADAGMTERGRGLPAVPFGLAYPIQSLLAALPNAGVYALLATTYSLVYGLSGRINLAFGEIAAVGGFAALIGAALQAGPSPGMILSVALTFALWAAGMHGTVIERLVLWPLRRSTRQQGLVATIGLALFLQEGLRLASANQPKYIPSVLSGSIGVLRAGSFIVTITPLSLFVFGIAMAAAVGILAVMRWTGFGRAWRATSDDPVAAALFGVDPRRLSMQTFVLACGLCGLAGACVTLISGSVGFAYTTTLGLKALIAAIIGGIGSVPGAFLGGLGIALIEAGWSAYFPIVERDLVIDSLLVAMLVLRPGGIFGDRELSPRGP